MKMGCHKNLVLKRKFSKKNGSSLNGKLCLLFNCYKWLQLGLICCFKLFWINLLPPLESIKRPGFNSREPLCMSVAKGHEFNPQVVHDLEARFQGHRDTFYPWSQVNVFPRLFLTKADPDSLLLFSSVWCLCWVHWTSESWKHEWETQPDASVPSLDSAKKKINPKIYNLSKYWHIWIFLGSLFISNEHIDV